jgi:hypothetical protein
VGTSGVQSSPVNRFVNFRWIGSMERRIDWSRWLHGTDWPKTFSQIIMPLPFIQAICSSMEWSQSQRRIWCCMWRRSNHLLRMTPGAWLSSNHWAQERWWS